MASFCSYCVKLYLMCCYFAESHILTSASYWVCLGMVFFQGSCRPFDSDCSSNILHISSQMQGIFFAYVPCCSTNIFSWLQLMNCSCSCFMASCILLYQILCFLRCMLTSLSGLSVLQLTLLCWVLVHL